MNKIDKILARLNKKKEAKLSIPRIWYHYRDCRWYENYENIMNDLMTKNLTT